MSTSCAMCAQAATFYCAVDEAALCARCDAAVHANPVAARHVRRALAPARAAASAAAAPSASFSWGLDDAAVVPQAPPAALFAGPAASPAAADSLFDDIFGAGAADLLDFEAAAPLAGAAFAPPAGALRAPARLADDFMVPQMVMMEGGDLGVGDVSYLEEAEEYAFEGGDFKADDFEAAAVPAPFAAAPRARAPTRPAMSDAPSESSDDFVAFASDSDDEAFVPAPRRRGFRAGGGAAGARKARRGGRDAPRARALAPAEPELELTREERVARYREKRARRNFRKTVRYASRKAYAEVRPRIKGRFVSPEEFAAYRAGAALPAALEDADAVVPCVA
jgi:hypothetical protein